MGDKKKKKSQKNETPAAEELNAPDTTAGNADDPIPKLDYEKIKTTTALDELRVLEPNLDSIISALSDTTIFDDHDHANAEIHVTVRDLSGMIYAGKGAAFVSKKLVEWEAAKRRFVSVGDIITALDNNRTGKPDEAKYAPATVNARSLEALKAKDRNVDKLMKKLTQCHLFDDVAHDSLTVTIDDLWNLVTAGKSAKMVIRIVKKLEERKVRLKDFTSLVVEVKNLRKIARQENKAEKKKQRAIEEEAHRIEEDKLKQMQKIMNSNAGGKASPSAPNTARRAEGGPRKTDLAGPALPSLDRSVKFPSTAR